MEPTYHLGDCIEIPLEDNSVDLVFTSPPYENFRDYSIGYEVKGGAWVNWAYERFVECLRVSKGPVIWVVCGKYHKPGRYSLTPERLMIRLDEAGYAVRKPAIFHRYGVPGAFKGWYRSVYEPVIFASKAGDYFCDNKALGAPPKYKAGGDFSNRKKNGERVQGRSYPTEVKKTVMTDWPGDPGEEEGDYIAGGKVGGGHMGDPLANKNEAPFPMWLARHFLLTFCPPGGTVLDPFCGSGTTGHVASEHGLNSILMDVREDQIDLSKRRIGAVA